MGIPIVLNSANRVWYSGEESAILDFGILVYQKYINKLLDVKTISTRVICFTDNGRPFEMEARCEVIQDPPCVIVLQEEAIRFATLLV